MLRKIMKKAHKIAREKLEGDYQARLSIALRLAWEEEREDNMSKEKEYNSWYRRDKEYDQNKYELAKKDRKEWPEKSVEEAKKLLVKGNFGIKKNKDKRSIITFYNTDTMDKINVQERASGLRMTGKSGFDGVIEEDGVITGITVDEFVEIRDWAWENLEEVSI